MSCEIGTGTSHVNINEQTGYVVEPSSSKKLMEALMKLQNEPKLAKKFGENAAKGLENCLPRRNKVTVISNYIKKYWL